MDGLACGRPAGLPARLGNWPSPPTGDRKGQGFGTALSGSMPSRGPRSGASVLKTLWLWWSGPGEPDLDLCWRAYLRRFDIQHTFRFVRSALGWTTPALQTPDQADRWTWLIVAAYTNYAWPAASSRPRPALGTTPRPHQTHPSMRPQRISPTPPNPGHTSQCADIRQTRTRTPKYHPTTASNPLPSHQESRMTPEQGLIASSDGAPLGPRCPSRDPQASDQGQPEQKDLGQQVPEGVLCLVNNRGAAWKPTAALERRSQDTSPPAPPVSAQPARA